MTRRLPSCRCRASERAMERGKRSESSRTADVGTKGVKRRYRFLFRSRAPPSPPPPPTCDRRQTRCRTRGDHLSFLPKEEGIIIHQTPTAKIETARKNTPSDLNKPLSLVPTPRRGVLGISPFLRRCPTPGRGRRHLSPRGSSRGRLTGS